MQPHFYSLRPMKRKNGDAKKGKVAAMWPHNERIILVELAFFLLTALITWRLAQQPMTTPLVALFIVMSISMLLSLSSLIHRPTPSRLLLVSYVQSILRGSIIRVLASPWLFPHLDIFHTILHDVSYLILWPLVPLLQSYPKGYAALHAVTAPFVSLLSRSLVQCWSLDSHHVSLYLFQIMMHLVASTSWTWIAMSFASKSDLYAPQWLPRWATRALALWCVGAMHVMNLVLHVMERVSMPASPPPPSPPDDDQDTLMRRRAAKTSSKRTMKDSPRTTVNWDRPDPSATSAMSDGRGIDQALARQRQRDQVLREKQAAEALARTPPAPMVRSTMPLPSFLRRYLICVFFGAIPLLKEHFMHGSMCSFEALLESISSILLAFIILLHASYQ